MHSVDGFTLNQINAEYIKKQILLGSYWQLTYIIWPVIHINKLTVKMPYSS